MTDRKIEGVDIPSFATKLFYESNNKEVSKLIFENSICSLRKGLTELLNPQTENSNYKYAVIIIEQSLELLLKSRLALNDKDLIRIHKSNGMRIKTIDLEKSIKCLSEECSINISENDKKALKDFREFRNETEHFAFLGNKVVYDKILSYLVSFYWAFLVRNMPSLSFRSLLSRQQFDLARNFEHSNRKAYIAAKENISKFFNSFEVEERDISMSVCKNCIMDTLIVDNEAQNTKCFLCGEKSNYISDYAKTI